MNSISIVATVILLAVLVGGLVLEYVLAKQESKLPGLILPGLTLVWSFVLLVRILPIADATLWDMIIAVSGLLLTANVPTILLLAIYGGTRSLRKKKKQIDKMNIQDLD